MFQARKPGREKLFKKAMLARKERPTRQRTVPGETKSLPWVSVSLWSAFILVGGYILFFSPALLVQRVSIEGESVIPLEEYENFVETSLEGTYFGILKKHNYFLAPTREIARRMLERYPLLSDVTVERRFPGTLLFFLQEAPALLRWCSGGPCYGVREGKAVLIPYSEDDRYISSKLSVIDESALPVQVGATLPAESYLETFRAMHAGIVSLGIGELLAIATTPSRHSNELALSTKEGWRLLVAVNRPAEESLGMLSVFLNEYGKGHLDRSKLYSVDLRVEGKIFYAELGQMAEEVQPTESNPAALPERAKTEKKKKSDH